VFDRFEVLPKEAFLTMSSGKNAGAIVNVLCNLDRVVLALALLLQHQMEALLFVVTFL